jgi:hypothetical protein
MNTQTPYVERRRFARISPKGSVVLFAGEYVERGRVANISSGGLLAITAESSEIPLGTEVEVELRLDLARSEWLRFIGHVLRIDGCSIVLTLPTDSEPLARLMETSMIASGEYQRVRTAVLIDASAERRGAIAGAFQAAGCAVLAVSTPLEAIVRLGESQFDPELIVIADSQPSSISDDLRVFVEREHPHAKLVTISDDISAPPGSIHWLSSSNLHGDLIARIRDLLDRLHR